jgi:hypothetical protein
MRLQLILAGISLSLAGCAIQQWQPPFTDVTVMEERKAYVLCAANNAFSLSGSNEPALHIAQIAIRECELERIAVYDKLSAENAEHREAVSYVNSYMTLLDSTMVNQLALRLMEVRTRKKDGENVEDHAVNGENI